MSELVAVFGDENDHGGGQLQCDNNDDKFFINGKKVAMKDCAALPDGFGHAGDIVKPKEASSKFYIQGIPVHRNNDSRYCGAKTIAAGQTKFYSG